MVRVLVVWLASLMLLHAMLDAGHLRLEKVKTILIEKGISAERVNEIFASEQALHKEQKALKIISNIKNIKRHRKLERKANTEMLLKKALIRKHLRRYKKVYDKVEKDYKVNREIVAAILQKETALGFYKAYKHNALSVFVSLLKGLEPNKYRGRQKVRLNRFLKFAHDNLVALISYYELKGRDVLKADLRSSYAGAVGIPQFSPMHFDMIVSPNKQTNHDLHDMPTAIYSTANLLKNRFEWTKKVKYNRMKHLDNVIKRWRDFDTGTSNFVYEKNLEGLTVATFLNAHKYDAEVRYVAQYVKILKRYNFSTAYALGILQIAKASHE